jgi:hypothetical protein
MDSDIYKKKLHSPSDPAVNSEKDNDLSLGGGVAKSRD